MRAKFLVRTAALVALGCFCPTARADLMFVGNYIGSSFNNGNVLRYDLATGQPLGALTSPLSGPIIPAGIAFGPDGQLYVASRNTAGGQNQILRFDATGANGSVFATLPTSSFLNGIAFGPTGDLFVVDRGLNQNRILRVNGTTGQLIGPFATVTAGSDLVFGPDGTLYVSQGLATGAISRFNGTTGQSLGVLVPGLPLRSGGGLDFGPDGNLYVASGNTNEILRFNPSNGAFLGVFASGNGLNSPSGLRFADDGNLYVTNSLPNGSILRFDGTTGAFEGVFASGGQLNLPFLFAVSPSQVQAAPVPEPATVVTFVLVGLSALGVYRRRSAT